MKIKPVCCESIPGINYHSRIYDMSNTHLSPESLSAVLPDSQWAVVLYNDEVNTFDWVIECLVKYCDHNEYQAEQCAWFVHYKGKYAVKHGGLEVLLPICSVLCEQGLSAKLEQ